MKPFHPLDYVEATTAESPEVIALASPAQQLNYRDLLELVKQCARKLRELGVKPGDVVVTKLSPYWEWIFMNAIHHEAAIVCSGAAVPNNPPFEVNWLISDTSDNAILASNTIVIDQGWIDEAKAVTPLPDRIEYDSPESIATLMMTSGTTGTPKGAAFTITNLLERMTYFNHYGTVDTPELCLMGLSTIGGYFFALNAAKNGYAYLAVNAINSETVKLANTFSIDHLVGSSMQLDTYVDVLDTAGLANPTVTRITTAGAITPTAVFDRLKKKFNAEVVSIYGATETGGIVFKTIKFGDAPNDAGVIGSWAEVQIVDEAHQPLPPDEIGRIRCRGIGTVSGYFRDSDATAAKYKDGWFYLGDLGSLSEDGHLYIGGREDEIINLGGFKFDPQVIDEFAKLQPHVRDVATAKIERDGQLPQLAIGLVTGPEFSIQEFEHALRVQFPDRHPTIYAEVESIPRNQMQKVQRQLLAQLIIEKLN